MYYTENDFEDGEVFIAVKKFGTKKPLVLKKLGDLMFGINDTKFVKVINIKTNEIFQCAFPKDEFEIIRLDQNDYEEFLV